jgi:hypothetical protein
MGVPTAIADYSLFASDTLISIIGRAFPCLIRKLPKTASADTGIALMSTGSEIARARQRCHGAGAAQTMTKTPITIARLTEAAMRRRSSLYVWMLENHDIFKAVIAKAVRPNWHALAEAFAEDGQTDADGSKPTAECTRQTWWKVRKVVAARQVAQAKRQQTGSATRPVDKPAAPKVQPVRPILTAPDQQPTVADDDDDIGPDKPTFGTSQLR